MAARIQRAEQQGGFLRLEVCPTFTGGACQCSDPGRQHAFPEYAGAPPAGAARRAWQGTCAREALLLVEAAPPVVETVAALVGLTL
ncbi:MAG: hypothetical protein Q7R32_00430 [Dehalococcoidia bacterium]|nr:hypothetical protein [Dehalococcoidia bacterium]